MDDEQILEVIRTQPGIAAEALATLPPPADTGAPRTAASYALAATLLQPPMDHAEYWLEQLKQDDLVAAFVSALEARGVTAETAETVEFEDPTEGFPFDESIDFLIKAKSFRCRILKNGKVAGSGVLVGPRLVLTAWHVIAVPGPGNKPAEATDLAVVLADNTKETAVVPIAWGSPCGDDEFRNILPVRDADVANLNDVAILQMASPAGIRFGFVPLGPPPPVQRSGSPVLLIHYPEGKDKGWMSGRTARLKKLTARWGHNAGTAEGSSGGALFNRQMVLVGVHQGRYEEQRRFVPLGRFLDDVLKVVSKDVAPTRIWSLDGTVDGKLVVARDLFFETIAAAGESSKRVRGIRIKRKAIGAGAAGLAFSHDILEQLLARRGPSHVLVRVTQDAIVPDLVAEIRRLVKAKGIDIPEPANEPAVAPGQAPPETTAKDRAAILAAAIEAAALRDNRTVWFFFDNPTVAMTEAVRLGFEGFVDGALVQPHLRLVIAGFETLSLPGLEFAGAAAADTDHAPGLVVEFLGGFRRSDLINFLNLASDELTGARDDAVINFVASSTLKPLIGVNETYSDEDLATIMDKLRQSLRDIRDAAGTP